MAVTTQHVAGVDGPSRPSTRREARELMRSQELARAEAAGRSEAAASAPASAVDASPATRPGPRIHSTDEIARGLAPSETTSRHGGRWRDKYAKVLMVSDLLIVFATVLTTQWLWLGVEPPLQYQPGEEPGSIPYWFASIAVALLWVWILSIYDTRDYRIVGSGSDEYKRIFHASLVLTGAVAIIVYLLRVELARGFVLIAFPVGTVLLITGRWLWRQWLHHRRRRGRMLMRVLVVGSPDSVRDIASDLRSQPAAGYTVVGAQYIDGSPRPESRAIFTPRNETAIPVYDSQRDIPALMDSIGADTVVIASTSVASRDWLRNVGWSLDPVRHYLIVAPGLVDVGGPRIAMRPVAGLPLMHVDAPRLSRVGQVTKRVFDFVATLLGLVLISPLLVLIALVVKLGDGGPVFFLQERIGLDGRTFRMVKFRSMRVDAEEVLERLQAEREAQGADAGNSVLFKMKDDPRVTRVGKLLRRFSLDELPQLFNVLTGSMSLVGPRPPLEREVAQYEDHVHRRFFVKPGITGLWQVSGRSNLSWEESVRLDLFYVENWSLAGDLVILWRTGRAVFGSDGAY